MPNILPVSDLRNYNEVLKNCQIGEPVFLTKNGRGKFVVMDIEDYEREKAEKKLLMKLQEAEEVDDSSSEEPVKQPVNITIIVNGQRVVLSGKTNYIVVDLFQFYPFDLTMVRGNLVFLHNGNDADYSSPLNDGDVIELRWEDK